MMVAGDIEHKPWGTTRLLHADENLQVAQIVVHKAGYCSLHYHCHKCNLFVLVSGALWVWTASATWRLEERGRRECHVPPRVRHRFVSPAGCTALEVYIAEAGFALEIDDIVRLDSGGTDWHAQSWGAAE